MAYYYQSNKCQRSLDLLLVLILIVWSVVVSSPKENTCSDEEGNMLLCTEEENSKKINKADPSIQQQCQLYLAPSSIPNAGIGVYTTVPFQKGDRIGENELLIPIVHIPQEDDNYDGWLIDDVRWGVWIDPRLYYEANPDTTQIFLPGFGAAINCNFELNNVEHKTPQLDSAGLHRSQDPGVGAFTYWHDTPNIATRDIQSGEELFIDYGKEWFEARAEAMGSKEPKDADPSKYGGGGGDPSSIRSQEWLKEHGICYDNLYANLSTISQAGRGAFAKRFFPKDSVVSPAPVLQLKKEHLFHEPTDKYELLFNYAYGHPDSPILLLPYSSIVNFINHNSQHPNVKLRWSTSPLHRNDFLQLSPEQVFKQRFGLMMEFVALRDIYPHEEIFLDYGVEWERAWQKHVNDWSTPEVEMHMTAEEAMAKIGILTEDEQTTKSYPKNVRTACFFNDNEHTFYEHVNDDDDDDDFFKTFKVNKWHSTNDECLRWCTILERRTTNDNEVVYDVLIEPQTAHLLEDCILPDDEIFYVNNVPSNKVTLVDVEYSRDQHLPYAFRHFIPLPDNLYPDTWKQKHRRKMDS